MVERITDFNNPRQQWRRLFSEVMGTFLLVLVAAGAGMMNAAFDGAVGRTATVVAPGLMVMAMILFMGKVSRYGVQCPDKRFSGTLRLLL